MSSEPPVSSVVQIGETAGLVWKALSEKGPLSIAKLIKMVDEPRDLVMQAIGWLAREEKISIEEQGRSRVVSLR
jgi:hypothetical protein